MKKLLAVVAAVGALSLGLPSAANAAPGVRCDTRTVDLRLGDGTDVGDVTVSCTTTNYLQMLFVVDDPYVLTEVHGTVEDAEDCPGVIVTKRGNVKVGKFPESMMFRKQAGVQSHTLTFDIYGFATGTACGAGHVDLRNTTPPPPTDEAWADDGTVDTILFDDPLNGTNPSGATYFDIEIIGPS